MSVDEAGKQHYLDVNVAYRQACLNAIEYLKKFGYSGAQAYSILGTAPVQGHISGVVDVPNACATLWVPTQIFEFDINPNAAGPVKHLDGSHRDAAVARPHLNGALRCLPMITCAPIADRSRRCGAIADRDAPAVCPQCGLQAAQGDDLCPVPRRHGERCAPCDGNQRKGQARTQAVIVVPSSERLRLLQDIGQGECIGTACHQVVCQQAAMDDQSLSNQI